MDVYAQIITKIIEKQETIIGPIAIEQAEQVAQLSIDWGKHEVAILADSPPQVIDSLVNQYRQLFGPVSVEVCRDAASALMVNLAPENQPSSLK